MLQESAYGFFSFFFPVPGWMLINKLIRRNRPLRRPRGDPGDEAAPASGPPHPGPVGWRRRRPPAASRAPLLALPSSPISTTLVHHRSWLFPYCSRSTPAGGPVLTAVGPALTVQDSCSPPLGFMLGPRSPLACSVTTSHVTNVG
jgi:hypothetical protein